MPMQRKVAAPAAFAAALAASAALASAQTSFEILTQEGKSVTDVGTITRVSNVVINNAGTHVIEVDTDNPDTDIDVALLRDGDLFLREGQSIPPAGALLDSFDDFSLNDSGSYAANFFLDGTGSTSNDSGLYYNGSLVIQEGEAANLPGVPAADPWVGFFGVKLNDAASPQVLVNGNTSSAVNSTLAIYTLDASGVIQSGELIAYEGATLSGLSDPVQGLETSANEFALNDAGQVLFAGDTTGDTASDSFVYLTGTGVLAQEGTPSIVSGRDWNTLSSPELDLNNSGEYVFVGRLAGDTASDYIIVRNGAKFVQEGDAVPDLPGLVFNNLASAQVQIDDFGNVLFVGGISSGSTSTDRGLFYNDTLLLQEGVSMIDGQLVTTINTLADTLFMSDNGQYAIIDVVLDGSLDTAVLIHLPIPEPGLLSLLAAAPAALLRRRR